MDFFLYHHIGAWNHVIATFYIVLQARLTVGPAPVENALESVSILAVLHEYHF